MRATGEGDPDTVMCDAEGDELESDRSPIISDTDVRNPVTDFSERQLASRGKLPTRIPRLEAI